MYTHLPRSSSNRIKSSSEILIFSAQKQFLEQLKKNQEEIKDTVIFSA